MEDYEWVDHYRKVVCGLEKIENRFTGYTNENGLTCLSDYISGKITPYLWQDNHQKDETDFFTTVDRRENPYFQKVDIHFHNMGNKNLTFKLFFTCDSVRNVSASFYSPADSYIYMYGKNTISLLNGSGGNRIELSITERKHYDAIYRAMETGQLIHSPLARGWVICLMMHEILLRPGEKRTVSSWQIHSQSKEEALLLDWLIENQTSNYA